MTPSPSSRFRAARIIASSCFASARSQAYTHANTPIRSVQTTTIYRTLSSNRTSSFLSCFPTAAAGGLRPRGRARSPTTGPRPPRPRTRTTGPRPPKAQDPHDRPQAPMGRGKTKTPCRIISYTARKKRSLLNAYRRVPIILRTAKAHPLAKGGGLLYNVDAVRPNGRCVGVSAPAQALGCWRTRGLPHFCFPCRLYQNPHDIASGDCGALPLVRTAIIIVLPLIIFFISFLFLSYFFFISFLFLFVFNCLSYFYSGSTAQLRLQRIAKIIRHQFVIKA